MRKSGLKQRSRRKQSSNNNNNQNGSNGMNGMMSNSSNRPEGGQSPTSMSGGENGGDVEQRRKPTSEEAALTAKNYRLAKELSDLRVRHRDETKTVTRLTMENMNLASRCREAISHVAMLKKELAMHQRRAAEALALQRQQVQRTADQGGDMPVTSTSMTVAMEMDRILSAPPPPPPPPKQVNNNNISFPQEQQRPFSAFPNSRIGALSLTPQSSDQQHPRASPRPVVPAPLSSGGGYSTGITKKASLQHRSVQRPGVQEDVPVDEMMVDKGTSGGFGNNPKPNSSSNFFASHPQRHPTILPSTPEKSNLLEDTISDTFSRMPTSNSSTSNNPSNNTQGFPHPPRSLNNYINETMPEDASSPSSPSFPTPTILKNRKSMTATSSIDAFEASFSTTFPTSFANPMDENNGRGGGVGNATPALDVAFDVPEFSDPFFLGSLDDGGGIVETPSTRGGGSGGAIDTRDSEMRIQGVAKMRGSASGKANAGEVNKTNHLGRSGNGGGGSVLEGKRADGGTTPAKSMSGASTAEPPRTSMGIFPNSALGGFDFSQQGSNNNYQRGTPNKTALTPSPHTDNIFQTPPTTGAVTTGGTGKNEAGSSPYGNSLGGSPQRPEKTGASVARARYEAALGEQAKNVSGGGGGGGGGVLSSETPGGTNVSVGGEFHQSPTLVLRRLHQRRAKEKAESSPQKSPGRNSPQNQSPRHASDQDEVNNESPPHHHHQQQHPQPHRRSIPTNGETTSKRPVPNRITRARSFDRKTPLTTEIRNIDAPEASPSLNKSRRNIKQPISYAEPSLHSKLRRGDVFFPKEGGNNSAGERSSPEKESVVVRQTAAS